MRPALMLAALLVLAGCLSPPDAPAPAEEGPQPAPDAPGAPAPAELPSNDDVAPTQWALTAVGCEHDFYTFLADRAAVIERLPEEALSYGNATVAFVYLFVHQCDAMVHGNDSLAKDVTLATLYVDVVYEGDRLMFLLESLTDWPYLAQRLDELGAVVRLVDVETDDLGAFVFAGDDLHYRMEPNVPADGEPGQPRTHDLRTGPAAEHLMRYEIALDASAPAALASLVQVEGGALGDILPSGTVAVTRHDSYGSFRIIEQNQT